MSSATSSQDTTPDSSLTANLKDSWKWLLAAGAVIAILGLIAMFAPFVTGLSLTILIGALLMVGGVFHILGAFRAQGWSGFIWQMILGALGLLAGAALLFNTTLGLFTLTIMVIAYLFVSGVVEIVMGIRMRGEKNWLVNVASGTIGILLAGMLWVGFPTTALWAIGVLFGVNLLVTGGSMVILALGARSASKPVEVERPAGAGGI